MKVFSKDLINIARGLFPLVYVDTETETEYIGSLSSYAGDRIRIYATTWFYEDPDIIRTDEELKQYINEYMEEMKTLGIEFQEGRLGYEERI